MHDDTNIGHAIGNASKGLGTALMNIMSISEGRVKRAYELQRQGMLDDRAADRLRMDEELLELNALRTNDALAQNAYSRANDRLERIEGIAAGMREDVDLGWDRPRDPRFSITHPGMSLALSPTTIQGPQIPWGGDAPDVSVGGQLVQAVDPYTEPAPTFDPTQSLEYRQAQAIGEMEQEQFLSRVDAMGDRDLTVGGSRLDPLRDAGVAGGAGDMGDVSDLPVGQQDRAQKMITSYQTTTELMGLAEEFRELGLWSRWTAGQALPFGLGQEGQELVARIEALKSQLVLDLKEVGNLGVLAGPDMDLLDDIVGEITSAGALMRSPEYTFAKLREVQNFITKSRDAFQTMYGIRIELGDESIVDDASYRGVNLGGQDENPFRADSIPQ